MKTHSLITVICEATAMLFGLFSDSTNLILFGGFIMIGTILIDYTERQDRSESMTKEDKDD